jgi:hypothetical protein
MTFREWWCKFTRRHGTGLILRTTYGLRCWKCFGFIKIFETGKP